MARKNVFEETPEEYNARIDAETAKRTSKYDQDIKERARVLGINPDNFHTEEELKQAVEKLESEK